MHSPGDCTSISIRGWLYLAIRFVSDFRNWKCVFVTAARLEIYLWKNVSSGEISIWFEKNVLWLFRGLRVFDDLQLYDLRGWIQICKRGEVAREIRIDSILMQIKYSF